jgi:hypothetical protein
MRERFELFCALLGGAAIMSPCALFLVFLAVHK